MDVDKILYNNFINGDEVSLKKIVEKYRDNIFYVSYQYVKDEKISNEIFQKVVSFILNNKNLYNFKFEVKSFILMITKKYCLKYAKENNITDSIKPNDNLYNGESLIDTILSSKENADKVYDAMSSLKSEEQNVVNLCVFECESFEEASKTVGKSQKELKNLLEKAKKKIIKNVSKAQKKEPDKLIILLSIILVIAIVIFGVVFIITK